MPKIDNAYPDPTNLEELIDEVDKYLELLAKLDRDTTQPEREWVFNHPLRRALAGGPIGAIERARSLRDYLTNLLPAFQRSDEELIDEVSREADPHFGDTPFQEEDYQPEPDQKSDPEEDIVEWTRQLALEIHHNLKPGCNCSTPAPFELNFAGYLIRKKGWRPPSAPRTVTIGSSKPMDADVLHRVLEGNPRAVTQAEALTEEYSPEELSPGALWKLRDPRADRLQMMTPTPPEPFFKPSPQLVAQAVEFAGEVLTATKPDPHANGVPSDRPLVPKYETMKRLWAADTIIRAARLS